jgi:cytoskeletal protein CcmA (bactofilin family)
MTAYLSVTALIAVTTLLCILPLIPALTELHGKSDAEPLSVIQQHSGEIRHFANSFRGFVQKLHPILNQCVENGSTAVGILPGGDQYCAVGRMGHELAEQLSQRSDRLVFLIGADFEAPPGVTFSKELYVAGDFTGSAGSQYRAILSDQSIRLGASSILGRWAHAVQEFCAENDCQLFGRVSSDVRIRLHAGCTFQRLNAPRIEVASELLTPKIDCSSEDFLGVPPTTRELYHGDFEIGPKQVIRGSIVARGRIHVGPGAHILGSVKSGRDLFLDSGVSVSGSLISAQRLTVGAACLIRGPVIAERSMLISTGTRCGVRGSPTTLSAPRIELQEGVVVAGTVWARELGRVVAAG